MNSTGDDTSNSETKKFERQHEIEELFQHEHNRDKVVVSVIDTGIGIKNKDRIKLFKLFGTLKNTRQMNTQGIGLGLVISENIVKEFNGIIGVKSKYGKGTKFALSMLLGKNEDYIDL